MKKEYIKPEMLAQILNTEEMIATSVGLSDDPAQGDYPGGGDADSRFSFSDDELDW